MKKLFVFITVFTVFCSVGIVSAQTSGDKSSQIVRIADKYYYLHTVAQGQTVYSLTKLYGVSEEQFYEENPAVKENGLKAGEVVKVICNDVPEIELPRRKMQKTFSVHNVKPGETMYSISKQYSLSVNTLVEDNPGIDPTHLQVGQEVRIRKSEMDKTSPQVIMEQMDDFANKLSIVSDEYNYHLIEIGETLYGISKKYNVPVEVIEANNAGIKDGLRAGLLLRIPIVGKEKKEEIVPEKKDLSEKTVTVGLTNTGTLNISVLLPLTESGVLKNNFFELYQGALVAADELREKGNNVVLNLYNTEHSAEAIKKITEMRSFRESDIVIGPVYEEGLRYVTDFASERGIPVVSPLANIEGAYGQTLFQLSPDSNHRYEQLSSLVEGKNIVFITSDATDAEFEREMKDMIGNQPYQKLVYRKGTPSSQINSMMADSDRENVFIVVAGNESGVDLILAALSSIQNTRISRSQQTGSIMVVGSSKWNRYRNMDRNLFFKLNVTFVTSYHADRGNSKVVDFDNRYIAAFGQIPSLYSYRGYDAVMMFGQAATSGSHDFNDALRKVSTPLETSYNFISLLNGKYVNSKWATVTYGNDYTIRVK